MSYLLVEKYQRHEELSSLTLWSQKTGKLSKKCSQNIWTSPWWPTARYLVSPSPSVRAGATGSSLTAEQEPQCRCVVLFDQRTCADQSLRL